jgi:pimeloyl-ACP methyl ester carboxylesterase
VASGKSGNTACTLRAPSPWSPVTTPIQHPPVEACLAQLLDHFGIARAHFAGRSLADVQGFIAKYPDRVASLTLARRGKFGLGIKAQKPPPKRRTGRHVAFDRPLQQAS